MGVETGTVVAVAVMALLRLKLETLTPLSLLH
jgi:hypothetical protein